MISKQVYNLLNMFMKFRDGRSEVFGQIEKIFQFCSIFEEKHNFCYLTQKRSARIAVSFSA